MVVVPAGVRRARRAAERQMKARLEVKRFGDEVIIDPDTLQATQESTRLYRGKGKIQSYEAHPEQTSSGGGNITITRVQAHFPVGSFQAEPGDTVTVLDEPQDPLLNGLVLKIISIAPYKSAASAYRVFCEEVVS